MTSERVHRYLDGELPREALTTAERAEAERLGAVLARAAAELRAAPVPDLAGRVMAALPAAPPSPAPRGENGWRRAWRWLWVPRPITFSFRPGYSLAMLALAGVVLTRLPEPSAGTVAAPLAAAASPVYVQFRLDAAGARRVELAGTFTGWQPKYALRQTAPGVWAAVVPLRPGVHDYAFLVDGRRWVADPSAPRVADDFGGTNSRLSLLPPGAGA